MDGDLNQFSNWASHLWNLIVIHQTGVTLAGLSAIFGFILPSISRTIYFVVRSYRRRKHIGFAEGIYNVYRINADTGKLVKSTMSIKLGFKNDYKFDYELESTNIPSASGVGYFKDGKIVLECHEKYGEFLIIFNAWGQREDEFIEIAAYCGIRAVGKTAHAGLLIISSKELSDDEVRSIIDEKTSHILSGVRYNNLRRKIDEVKALRSEP